MFIILRKDDFFGYEIVLDYLGKPKLFENDDMAYHFAKEMELQPYQIIEVTI